MTTTTLDSADRAVEPARKRDLTPLQRLFVGGLGGITPIVATLMAGEHENLPLPDFDGLMSFYLGFGFRVMMFFCVGALFVWLHHEVRGRYAVFRLGLTAPALIAAMIGAAPAEAAASRTASIFGNEEVRVAALEIPGVAVTMSDVLPEGVVFKKRRCTFLDGFLGRKCKK